MTVINDPIYGFISIPRGLLRQIIAHPYFQRLERIRQLGTSTFVYPSAQHTRRSHSIGAYHLCKEAFRTLAEKGEFLFDSEVEQTEAAILMHDLGHAPYSHVLESVFTPNISHEDISLLLMQRINEDLRGELNMAVSIFKDEHPKRWLHELLSSQLDVDRLDYLRRDSFHTGVHEGNIGTERIIKMLAVSEDGHLVVNHKGLYSVENYLMTRRLMYWQVYLHKTTVAAEEVLRGALRRARMLALQGENLFASPSLRYFLEKQGFDKDDPEFIDHYILLDDSDILTALKVWQSHKDRVLAILSSDFINRRLFKAKVYDVPVLDEDVEHYRRDIQHHLGITYEETEWLVRKRTVSSRLYNETGEAIGILQQDGTVKPLSEISHIVQGDTVGLKDIKHYLFHQRLS